MLRTARFPTLFTALLALACASAQKPAEPKATVTELPNDSATAKAEAPPAPAALKTVTAEEGFSVQMPGEPQVQRNKVAIPAGDVSTAAWTVNENGVIYSISIADYPEKIARAAAAEKFLAEGQSGLANQLKGTVKDEQPVTISGFPGKAYTVESPNGEVKARNYFVAPRLYTLLVLYNPSLPPAQADAFLESLALTNPPPAPAAEGSQPAAGATGDSAATGGSSSAGDAETTGTTAATPSTPATGSTAATGGSASTTTAPAKKKTTATKK